MSRKMLERLSTPSLVAVRCRGDAWPVSVFAPTLIPDAWMGLVIRADGRRRFVPAGEDPRPECDDTLVLVRNRTMTVPVQVAEVPANDGHAVSAAVELLLRCPARDDELAALRSTLLNAEELTLDLLSKAVNDAGVPAALRRFIQERAAPELVNGDLRSGLLEALRLALKRFLFSAGLELERIGQVEFTSETLARHAALQQQTTRRVKEIEARGVVEHAALAATRRRIEGLSEILTKLKVAAAGGDMQWRELLPSLTPGERGRLLENLWRLTPDRTVAQAIVVAAGYECVWLDPQRPQAIVRRVTLPGELGGLRSISFDSGGDALLVGAGTGIWRLSAATGDVLGRYAVPSREPPRTGFNAAAVARGGARPWEGGNVGTGAGVVPTQNGAAPAEPGRSARLFATHSQLGAWLWSVDDPTDALPLLQPIGGVPKTVRAVCINDRGQVLVAADDRVHAYTLAGDAVWQSGAAGAAIHCLAPLEEHLYTGTAGGTLLRCDLKLPGDWLVIHRTLAAIESVQARRWDDLVELVIPAGPDGVCGVYAAEGIVSRLLHVAVPLRRAWACDDALLALSEHRDRLFVLNAAAPERVGCDVPIARLLGRLVQDACIVTSHAATQPRSHEGEDT